jgi:hypothetical protein
MLPFDKSGLNARDIWLANGDGTNRRKIIAHQVDGEGYASPVYSPDERYLYNVHTTPIMQGQQLISATLELELLDMQTQQKILSLAGWREYYLQRFGWTVCDRQ